MKNLKKILAVVLAVVLMAALSVTMFAVDSDATKNASGGIESTDNTIKIKKDVVFVNDESTNVRQPNITYTYTLSAVTNVNATIKDSNGVVGKVKDGVAAAIKTGTATIALADTATAPASSAGTALTNYAQFEFQPTGFEAPGIYRYKISETTNVTKASVGIVEASGYVADRYLDVYVSRTSNTDNTLKIYGYVLFEDNDTANTSFDAAATPTENLDEKSEGFVNPGSGTGATLTDVDTYTTQNLYINKKTTGALADKNNDFPIAVTLTAPQGVSNVKLDVTVSGNGTLTNTDGYIATWGTVNGTVRDGSKIAIKGIPAGAKVSIVETNNAVDSYKVKAGTTDGGTDLLTEALIAPGAAAGATSEVTINAKSEIFFTNTLETISPTGVMIRFAPFAIILLAGVALFVIARRRRVED